MTVESLLIKTPSRVLLYGSLVTYPLFLVPVLFGEKFPWLLDWCSPILLFAKMMNATMHCVQFDKKADLDPLNHSSEDWRLLQRHMFAPCMMLLYLFFDCFVTTEKFYSRMSNFVAYYTAFVYMCYSFLNELETKEICLFFIQLSTLILFTSLFSYLVNRQEVEQFVKKYTTD